MITNYNDNKQLKINSLYQQAAAAEASFHTRMFNVDYFINLDCHTAWKKTSCQCTHDTANKTKAVWAHMHDLHSM